MTKTTSLLSGLGLALALTSAGAAAQVDFVYTNISTTAGNWADSITLWSPGNIQRPLACERTIRGATESVRKVKLRTVNGRPYIYWMNTFIQDGVYRATDRNGNGAFDSSEIETLFVFDAASQGFLDEAGGKWWVCNGAASGNDRGLWLMQDLNNDGDFLDAGEANQVLSGPSHTFGATTISSDDIRALVALPNGDCVFHEDDVGAWFRCTPGGTVTEFLTYKPTGDQTPPGTPNPDFGTALPAVTRILDRVAFDPATNRIYFSINFNTIERFVFWALDGNNDGDVNDPGEVRLFFDGSIASPVWGPIDDIEWLNGSLYVSYEIDTVNDPGCQFQSLTDLNNDGDAQDNGELVQLGRTDATDDPTLLGLTVVPSGTFRGTCVRATFENDSGMTQAGGTVSFSFRSIPTSLQGGNVVGLCALSLTGDIAVPLPGGCLVGIVPDGLTAITLPLLVTAPFTTGTAAVPAFSYPANLPLGLNLYFAGLMLDTTSFQFEGVTATGLITVTN